MIFFSHIYDKINDVFFINTCMCEVHITQNSFFLEFVYHECARAGDLLLSCFV